MKFKDFEHILSHSRIQRYVDACNGDTRKAMTLYRLNLHLSQEMFTIVSCFEVALRNAIDKNMIINFGNEWLKDAQLAVGIFDNKKCYKTKNIIRYAYNKAVKQKSYSHEILLIQVGIFSILVRSSERKKSKISSENERIISESLIFIHSFWKVN